MTALLSLLPTYNEFLLSLVLTVFMMLSRRHLLRDLPMDRVNG